MPPYRKKLVFEVLFNPDTNPSPQCSWTFLQAT